MAAVPTELTIIYITANVLPESFVKAVQHQLVLAIDGQPLISVSKKPMDFGTNICVGDTTRSQAQIYKQLLIGAKAATSTYIAVAEDDTLYHAEHFKHRPHGGHWDYNMNTWNLYTWGTPVFSYKAPGGRRNLSQLICEREMLIEHLEERFKLWPDDSKIDIRIFGEPGKYDNQLGTTPYPSQDFYINPPNIVFSHQANLQFEGLGTRKALGQIRATSVPYWGNAKTVRELYQ